MKHLKSSIFFLFFIFIFNYGFTQESRQLRSYNDFRSKVASNSYLNWNLETSTIKQFHGKIPLQYDGKSSTSRLLLENFFQENKDLFGIDEEKNTLSFKLEKVNRNTTLFIYQQYFKGIPVFRHKYRIRMNKQNELISLKGMFNPKVFLSTINPILTEKDAQEVAFYNVSTTSHDIRYMQTELTIFSKNNEYFLAWKITFEIINKPESWLFLVNALNGDILLKESLEVDVTGSGNAYDSHPGNGSPVSKSLYFLGTSHYLDGTYVKTNNSDASNAYSSNYQYFFSSSHTSFDEVNVYYHVTQMQNNFFKALDPSYNPIKRNAWVHYLTDWDNATASSSGTLRFGDGYVTFNDLAKDESVIYHENTHVVIYETSDLLGGNSEQGALHEGWADYFAASFAPGPVDHEIAEWATKASGPLRDLENNATFNGSFSQDWTGNGEINQYDYALVWGGALWDCRQSPHNIPASVIDWISYDALYSLNYGAKFSDALTAILESDEETYYPNHASAIRFAFNNRGIYESVTAWISGPDFMQFKEQGTWQVHPSGGNSSFTYQWQYRPAYSSTWTNVGSSQSYSRTMGLDDFELKCTVTSIYGLSATDFFYVYNAGSGGPPQKRPAVPVVQKKLKFQLVQNYPNPFNPTTNISYSIDSDQLVELSVYNVIGKKVKTLVNETQSIGQYNVLFNATDLPSGVYYFKLTAGNNIDIKKGIYVR